MKNLKEAFCSFFDIKIQEEAWSTKSSRFLKRGTNIIERNMARKCSKMWVPNRLTE